MRTTIAAALLWACALGAATAEDEAAPEFAPLPYTANQIRGAMPRGFRCVYVTTEGEDVVKSVWTVLASDVDGASIEFRTLDAAGTEVGEPEVRRSAWTELRDHAQFPAALTTIQDATIEVPAGAFECWLYTLTVEADGGTTVRRFWFAKEKPGAPVRFETVRDGALVSRSVLTELQKTPAKK